MTAKLCVSVDTFSLFREKMVAHTSKMIQNADHLFVVGADGDEL